jgi:beta-xylosidase
MYQTIRTRRTEYSEGPIFFKRKGIYYYLYTIGGNEGYEYYYQMSRTSPLGPWTTPEHDLVCTTDIETGVFGPGHGCVFNVNGTDDYYLVFLEYGRWSTNRQTYVNRLEFNDDGTIRQVKVDLNGVGYLHKDAKPGQLKIVAAEASSEAPELKIRHTKDVRCQRTETFSPQFAIDNQNGSRWMAAESDNNASMMIDMGKAMKIGRSEIAFVRPTAGHAYKLEASRDGLKWDRISIHALEKRSPHVDKIGKRYRYLRVSINEGVKGIWEWKVYK